MNYFKKNLKYLIKRFAITQAQLAFQVGKNQNTISNWINGVSVPDLDDLVLLYHFFGISIDYLAFDDLENSNLITDSHIQEMKINGKVLGKLSGNPFGKKSQILYNDNQQVTQVNEADSVGIWALLGQMKNIDQKIDLLIVSSKIKQKKGSK